MKPKFANLLAASTVFISLSDFASAASTSWKAAPTDASWVTATNWASGAAPGSTTANSTDVATFNAALSGTIGGSTNPIVIDTGRRLGGITFDTSSVGAFVIGSNAGSVLGLGSASATTTATTTMTSTVTTSQVIAAPIQMYGYASSTNPLYTFSNNSSTTAATLTLSGAITANISASRPTQLVLAGTNTGNNLISGNISSPSFAQGVAVLKKNGAGTWILSGSNTFSGSSVTVANAANGIQINAGVLVAQNNNALGSTTNSVNNYINSGGTLELNSSSANGSINLNNALTLQLMNGGTIRSNGSNTTSSILNVSTAATSTTISTIGSSDVFTIGNGANDFTGGTAGATVTRIAGPGTVLLGQASNYAGTLSIDSAGTLKLGNATGLGAAATAGVAFGDSSTGKLVLNGLSATVATLNSIASVGTVENNNATAATLTVSNTTGTSSYGGLLQDGAAGTLALTKAGASTLTLSGVNTYTGGTSISAGTLSVTNSSGSATGTGAVAVSGTGILGGTGTVSGAVTVSTGGTLTSGVSGVGTLHLSDVNLTGGANILLNGVASQMTSTGAVAITGSSNLMTVGGSAALAGNTYNFLTGSSLSATGISLTGSAVGNSTVALGSSSTVGRTTYAFSATATALQLAVTGGAWDLTWNGGSANWNTSDSIGQKDGSGSNIAFYAGDNMSIATADTITVDAAGISVGTLAVGNSSGTATLTGGALSATSLNKSGAGTLSLNSATSLTIAAAISGGTLDIGTTNQSFANVSLTGGASIAGSTGVLTGSGSAFDVQSGSASAILAGSVGLTKTTSGTVTLSGANTYTGTTTISGGTLGFSADNNLGASSAAISLNGGTLAQGAADVTGTHIITVGASGGTIDVGSRQYFLNTANLLTGSGALAVSGAGGSLRLGLNNSFSGTTAVNSAALVEVQNATGLGTSAVTVNSGGELVASNINMANALTANGGSTLSFDNGNSGVFSGAVSLVSGTTTVALRDWYSTSTARNGTISGVISGAGGLAVNSGSGSGSVLTLSSANSYAGGTALNAGTLVLGNATAAGSGAITAANGTTISMTTASGVGNAVTLSGTNASVTMTSNQASAGFGSNITGTADQTLVIVNNGTTVNFNNTTRQFANFLGTVNVQAGSALGDRSSTTTWTNGGDSTLFNVDGSMTSRNGGTWALGGLTGSGTLSMGTAGSNGIGLNYTIGARNDVSDTFSGVIRDGDTVNSKFVSVTKTGMGIQVFSGANSYTGTTTVSAGTLALSGSGTFGSGSLVVSGGTANLGGGSISNTLGALTGGGAINNGTVTNNGSNYDLRNGSVGAALAGTNGLSKTTSSTVTLDGTSTYTGLTSVTAGTLALGAAGSIDNSSGVYLGTGGGTFDVSAKSGGYTVAALTGSGNVTGALAVSTQLAIGNSPGTANFSSDLTLGGASTYTYEVVGSGTVGGSYAAYTADLGNIAGNLTITAGAVLDLVQLGTYTANDKFTLFSYSGTLTGTFAGLADDSNFTAGGGDWLINYNDTTGGENGGTYSNFVTITAVPEPNAAMLVGGLGMLALLRRRRA